MCNDQGKCCSSPDLTDLLTIFAYSNTVVSFGCVRASLGRIVGPEVREVADQGKQPFKARESSLKVRIVRLGLWIPPLSHQPY
jgi:hypothetical protein